MSKDKKTYPKHIGFIMDGNRRWAKKRGLPVWEGHRQGAKVVRKLFNWMKELDIKEITLYAFSVQNFDRDKKEVSFLMQLFAKAFGDLIKSTEIEKNKIRIRVVGEKKLLPKNLQKTIREIEEKTKKHDNYIVNFCIAYGGQEEIIRAVKKMAKDKINFSELNVNEFDKYLDIKKYPDIIIRTSGEIRTSNFLVWQQAYAEWFFVDKFWPDLNKKDIKNIINDYLEGRDRRFGK